MQTIEQLRDGLGWSQAELGKRAGISSNTVRRAEGGGAVSRATVTRIADAFSQAYGQRILARDIAGITMSK